MQQLADILQINTPGVKKYDSWGSTLKNKILKAYKSYGFSKGGVVRKGIPANILDMIGGCFNTAWRFYANRCKSG